MNEAQTDHCACPQKSIRNRRLAIAGGLILGIGLGGVALFWRTTPREPVSAKPLDARGGLITTATVGASNTRTPEVSREKSCSSSAQSASATTNIGVRTESSPATNEEFNPVHFAVLSGFLYRVRATSPNDRPTQISFVPIDRIPADIKAYDGQRVKITGFVLPLSFQGRGVTEFLLVRDQMSCCFGPAIQMNHWIYVKMKRGEFRPHMYAPVTVHGTLQVGEQFGGGSLESIYRMEAVNVTEAAVEKAPALPDWVKIMSITEQSGADGK